MKVTGFTCSLAVNMRILIKINNPHLLTGGFTLLLRRTFLLFPHPFPLYRQRQTDRPVYCLRIAKTLNSLTRPSCSPSAPAPMDYSFFPSTYPAADLQALNLNGNPQQQQQQPQRQNGQLSQLPGDIFFLDDPFNVKMETTRPGDIDHASFSSIHPLSHETVVLCPSPFRLINPKPT